MSLQGARTLRRIINLSIWLKSHQTCSSSKIFRKFLISWFSRFEKQIYMSCISGSPDFWIRCIISSARHHAAYFLSHMCQCGKAYASHNFAFESFWFPFCSRRDFVLHCKISWLVCVSIQLRSTSFRKGIAGWCAVKVNAFVFVPNMASFVQT